jgi:hypothetical protein
VSITSPANGSQVSAKLAINAQATDNVGVVNVVFTVDGKTLSTDTTAPYRVTWRPSRGKHTVTATAKDAAGNTATATINVYR